MSYEPTNWKDGDIVTSAKLNKLEQGVAGAGGILIANVVNDNGNDRLDKTWQEIHDSEAIIVRWPLDNNIDYYFVDNVFYSGNDYIVRYTVCTTDVGIEHINFVTHEADGYPVISGIDHSDEPPLSPS